MTYSSLMSRNGTQAYRLVCLLAVAAAAACNSGNETASAAGSWASLSAEGQKSTSVPIGTVGIGTSVWLEPTDLSTGLEPDRLHLRIGLLNKERDLHPSEITMAADSAQLVRWPGGSVVSSRVEVEAFRVKGQLRNLDAQPADAGLSHRAKVKVIPNEPLKPGWYALKGGPDGPVSRFHVGSCPIVVGLSLCDGLDGVAVVFSEPVSKDADVRVLSPGNGRTCAHDPQLLENRHQSKSMRRYVNCDVDATKEAVRVRVGDVTVREERNSLYRQASRRTAYPLLISFLRTTRRSARAVTPECP